MASVFTPEHSELDRIFAKNRTYRIPAYQRPYSWEAVGKSDRDRQVIDMWNDLWNFFQVNPQNSKEYFLGSMVIIEEADSLRTCEVIDGQQRLTTLLLLFAAMRCFLDRLEKQLSSPEERTRKNWFMRAIQTLDSYIYNEDGVGLVRVLKIKIERTIGANFNDVINSAISCKEISSISAIDKKHREIAHRYFRNRDYFTQCIEEEFFGKDQPVAANLDIVKFDNFFKFLTLRVALVLIKTADFSTAYRIFEILNNRGLPLTNLDLLRNFVIEQLKQAKVQDPDQRWERLERDYVLTEDFIGRWTESENGTQPQKSAFNEARTLFEDEEHYKPIPPQTKIELFYNSLESNLKYYNLIIEEEQRVENLSIQVALSFIKQLGNERYSTDLILALFRNRSYQGNDDDQILRFLCLYRAYAIHAALVGRFYSPKIYESIRLLNNGKLLEAQAVFKLVDKDKQALRDCFDSKFEKNEPPKLLLAACIWDEESRDPDVVKQHLQYDKSTLEHIIPQSPETGTNWLTDFDDPFRQDFTYKLGNMTLLTRATNSANRNYDFAKKRNVYAKAKLAMTARLAEQTRLTRPYLETRQQQLVEQLVRIFLL